MSSLPGVLIGDEVAFDRDLHAYLDIDGARRMSVTQAINIAGLVDYSMVDQQILAKASRRGQMVHLAAAIINRGDAIDEYILESDVKPYVDAYLRFLREMRLVPNAEWIERPAIVELFGQRVGMTPDVVGEIDGIPTLIELKTCSTIHPAWRLQTAGYAMGLAAAGLQIRQRFAVQLRKTGRYALDSHEDRGDFDSFGDVYRTAAWKLKHRLAELE